MALESKSWLYRQITIDWFEDERKGIALDEGWKQFKLGIIAGDELWTYSGGMGNVGIALLRNGEVVGDFIMQEP